MSERVSVVENRNGSRLLAFMFLSVAASMLVEVVVTTHEAIRNQAIDVIYYSIGDIVLFGFFVACVRSLLRYGKFVANWQRDIFAPLLIFAAPMCVGIGIGFATMDAAGWLDLTRSQWCSLFAGFAVFATCVLLQRTANKEKT